jgi:hypothetical protein
MLTRQVTQTGTLAAATSQGKSSSRTHRDQYHGSVADHGERLRLGPILPPRRLEVPDASS